jgi:hypothetical protein
MRLAWCRRALLDLLRRWGIYAVVAVMLVGAGAVGAPTIIAAMAAWAVLPLFHAVSTSVPQAGVAALAYTLFGLAMVWALRPLLLPRRWLDAERALPIAPAERRRSDRLLVAFGLLPLFTLYAVGSAVLLGRDPPWLQPHRLAAPLTLLASAAAAVALGALLLGARRRAPRLRHAVRADRMHRSGPRPWPWVLLLLPLWRGPARRCGGVLLATALLLFVPLAGLLWWPQGGGWWLAALAAAALALTARSAALAAEELAPLIEAAAMLPLPPATLRRAAAALPVLALLPALTALPAVLHGARPAVLAVFIAGQVAAAVMLSLWHPAEAETRAGRWLLCLVLLLALASEVLP